MVSYVNVVSLFNSLLRYLQVSCVDIFIFAVIFFVCIFINLHLSVANYVKFIECFVSVSFYKCVFYLISTLMYSTATSSFFILISLLMLEGSVEWSTVIAIDDSSLWKRKSFCLMFCCFFLIISPQFLSHHFCILCQLLLKFEEDDNVLYACLAQLIAIALKFWI